MKGFPSDGITHSKELIQGEKRAINEMEPSNFGSHVRDPKTLKPITLLYICCKFHLYITL